MKAEKFTSEKSAVIAAQAYGKRNGKGYRKAGRKRGSRKNKDT